MLISQKEAYKPFLLINLSKNVSFMRPTLNYLTRENRDFRFDQLSVARKLLSIFSNMLKNLGHGAEKVRRCGLKRVLTEGSKPPITALGWSDFSSCIGKPTIESQAVPNGAITSYGVMVSKFATPWRPEITSGLPKKKTTCGLSCFSSISQRLNTRYYPGACLGGRCSYMLSRYS